jgi:DNA-binding IclR family transcriptional regulator
MARQRTDIDESENGERDEIRVAQHIILNQLSQHHPAHLSEKELAKMVRSNRLSEADAHDALAELLAQGVVHRQGETDYHWLTRTVAYLGELGWSDESV